MLSRFAGSESGPLHGKQAEGRQATGVAGGLAQARVKKGTKMDPRVRKGDETFKTHPL